MRIKASALLYAVTVALLLGMIMGSLVLLTHFRNVRTERWLVHERIASNARSAAYAMLGNSMSEEEQPTELDLFGDGTDSATVRIIPWGGLDLLRSHAWHGDQDAWVTAFAGRAFPDDVILDLPRSAGPVHLCGDARLHGDVRVPQADVRRGHIEGRPFSGDRLVEGRILRSEDGTRSLRTDMQDRIQRLCMGFPLEQEGTPIPQELRGEDVVWDGTGPIPLLQFNGPTHLFGYQLRGPLIIRCNDSLSIDQENVLDMVLIQAPFIAIDPGAIITAQCFASEGILLGEGAELRFPSLLAVWRDGRSSEAVRIELGTGSLLQGAIVNVDRSIRGRQDGGIIIAPQAAVHGEVYAEGTVQLQGEVHGSVVARGFSLRTSASIYRGHILDGKIGPYNVGTTWGFGITDRTDERTILQWGVMEHG